MIKKKVSIFANALREIPSGTTASATLVASTIVPLTVRDASRSRDEIEAAGIRLLLGVTTRTAGGDLDPAHLSIYMEEKDQSGNWRGVLGSTMTPVVTATAWETLEIYPGLDVTTVPVRRSFPLPSGVRFVSKIEGSLTATPGFTYFLDAELLS